jgi:phage-related minor tail protein
VGNYLAALERANALEKAIFGRGDVYSQQQSGLAAIQEKFATEKARLSSQLALRGGAGNEDAKRDYDVYLATATHAYEGEVAAFTQRTATLKALQANWVNGATKALENYYDETQNAAKDFENAFSHAFQGLEDSLTSFVTGGKAGFADLAKSIVSDLARISIRENITGPLAKSLSDGAGSGGGGGLLGGLAQFLGLPSFAVGIDRVPHDMIAQIHQDERIVPAARNRGGGMQDNTRSGANVQNFFFTVGDVPSKAYVQSAVQAGLSQAAYAQRRQEGYS